MKETKTETAPLAKKESPIQKIKQAVQSKKQPAGEKKPSSAKKPATKKQSAAKKQPAKQLAPEKLLLLVTVVNREKADYYLDFIQSFNSNLQLDVVAFGTAQRALGLLTPDTEKSVLFSVITKTNSKAVLSALEEKFSTIRGGKGVAFTVPMTSTIGVLIYRFLANKE